MEINPRTAVLILQVLFLLLDHSCKLKTEMEGSRNKFSGIREGQGSDLSIPDFQRITSLK